MKYCLAFVGITGVIDHCAIHEHCSRAHAMTAVNGSDTVFVFERCHSDASLAVVDMERPLGNPWTHVWAEYPLTNCIIWRGYTLPTEGALSVIGLLFCAWALYRVRHSSWPHRLFFSLYLLTFLVRMGSEAVMVTRTAQARTNRDAFDVGVWITLWYPPFNLASSLLLGSTDLLLAYFWSMDGASNPRWPATRRRLLTLLGVLLLLVVVATVAYDATLVGTHGAALQRLPWSDPAGSEFPSFWILSLATLAILFILSAALHVYCFVRWWMRLRATRKQFFGHVVRPYLIRALVIGGFTAFTCLFRLFVVVFRATRMAEAAARTLAKPSIDFAYYVVVLYLCPGVVMVAFVGLRDGSAATADGSAGDGSTSSESRGAGVNHTRGARPAGDTDALLAGGTSTQLPVYGDDGAASQPTYSGRGGQRS